MEYTRQPLLSAFSDERKIWSRLLYRPRSIHCLPTGCRRHADTRRGVPRTSPKRPLAIGKPLLNPKKAARHTIADL